MSQIARTSLKRVLIKMPLICLAHTRTPCYTCMQISKCTTHLTPEYYCNFSPKTKMNRWNDQINTFFPTHTENEREQERLRVRVCVRETKSILVFANEALKCQSHKSESMWSWLQAQTLVTDAVIPFHFVSIKKKKQQQQRKANTERERKSEWESGWMSEWVVDIGRWYADKSHVHISQRMDVCSVCCVVLCCVNAFFILCLTLSPWVMSMANSLQRATIKMHHISTCCSELLSNLFWINMCTKRITN